jgi:ABC-type transport system involved in cytochrome c biogenesis ATPase subunit
MASRPAQEHALGEFLAAAASAPSALVVDGEAWIGKTTLLLAGLARAAVATGTGGGGRLSARCLR